MTAVLPIPTAARLAQLAFALERMHYRLGDARVDYVLALRGVGTPDPAADRARHRRQLAADRIRKALTDAIWTVEFDAEAG